MRIRSIRPEFWRSEDVKKHPRDVRLLFVGLWSYVDDNGVGVDDYRQIASDLFPLEDDPVEVREYVRDGLATLSRGLQIVRFGVDGKRFIFIPKWDTHQKIDRPGKERDLRPANTVSSENPTFITGHSDDSRDTRDSLDAGEGEKGRRGEGEKGQQDLAIVAAPAITEPDLFDAFWSNYPRKDNKAQARKAWPKACKRLEPERLVKAAAFWARLWEDVGKDREHIPHASTWLNNDRWNDERPVRPRAAPNSTDAHFAALLNRQRPGDGPQLLALPGGAS